MRGARLDCVNHRWLRLLAFADFNPESDQEVDRVLHPPAFTQGAYDFRKAPLPVVHPDKKTNRFTGFKQTL